MSTFPEGGHGGIGRSALWLRYDMTYQSPHLAVPRVRRVFPSFLYDQRADGIQSRGDIVDPALMAATPVYEYEPNTWGPSEVEQRVSPPGG